MAKVYLALGHGRRPNGTIDPGAVSADFRHTEQTAGAPIVAACAAALRAAGVEVRAQKPGDGNFVTYTKEASEWGADAAVSVHHDWNKAPRGAFGHWGPGKEESKRLADALYAAVEDAGLPMRPSWHKARSDLTFVTQATVPAVLWECDRIGEVTDPVAYGRALARGILAFLGISVAPKPEPQPAPAPALKAGEQAHTVVRGDTLSALAQRYRVKAAAIAERNSLADPNLIRIGQVLVIPARPAPAPKPPSAPANPYAGKFLRARVDLRFYDKPGWHPTTPSAGIVRAGLGFPTVVRKLKVGGGEQYEVRNSQGRTVYITANPQFVTLT